MRWRRSASTPALPASRAPPSGTARRDSPFRFGQERLGPTLRNPLRGHALGPGSGRETRGRRSDGGVGDGTVCIRERSRYNRGDGSSNAVAFFFCSRADDDSGQDQKENKRGHLGLQVRLQRRINAAPIFPQMRSRPDANQIAARRARPTAASERPENSGHSPCSEGNSARQNQSNNGKWCDTEPTVAVMLCRARKWDGYIPDVHHLASSSPAS